MYGWYHVLHSLSLKGLNSIIYIICTKGDHPAMIDIYKPLYEQIYNILKEKIYLGEFKYGERVPSEKELSQQFQVSRITTKKALQKLAEEGLIDRKPGKGSFVIFSGSVERQDQLTLSVTPLSKTSRSIAYIMPSFDDAYGTEIVTSIDRSLVERGAMFMLRCSFGKTELEDAAIRDFVQYGVDGIIIYPIHSDKFSDEILKLIVDRFPHVLVDRYLKRVNSTSVCTKNVEAARLGTNYLFELHHRHIAFLVPYFQETSIEDRTEGFVQAHVEKGIPIDKNLWFSDIRSTYPTGFYEGNPEINEDVSRLASFLKENPHVTAIFANEYHIGVLAKRAVESIGLKVPDNLSILCFDHPTSFVGDFRFTHIKQQENEIGRIAVETIFKKINGETVPEQITIDAELVVGNSTKALKN